MDIPDLPPMTSLCIQKILEMDLSVGQLTNYIAKFGAEEEIFSQSANREIPKQLVPD